MKNSFALLIGILVAVVAGGHETSVGSRSRLLQMVQPCMESQDGDGATVCRAMPQGQFPRVDPFLMLDFFHVSPPAGFPDHPHRFTHRDSLGNEGTIGPGEVQWMTAGSGIIHSEAPATDGVNSGMQLWVNLPRAQKMVPPSYQDIRAGAIPSVLVPASDGRNGSAKLIAGNLLGVTGPADTRVPILIADITVPQNSEVLIPIPSNFNAFSYIIEGKATMPGVGGKMKRVKRGDVLLFGSGNADETAMDTIVVTTKEQHVRFFLAAGTPLNEPIAQRGPFVMNTQAEINQAIRDYQQGKLVQHNPTMIEYEEL